MAQAHAGVPAPNHVPPDLVRPYPFAFGATTELEPFEAFVGEIHRGPEVFYGLNAYPGGAGAWIVRRAEDLRKIYFDTEHYTTRDFAPFAKLLGETWSQIPVEIDPPMHGVYRTFMNPLFTPGAVTRLEEKIRRYAREYIAAFAAKGECEFMSEFAFEFPIKVFLEMLGLPLEHTQRFLEWEQGLLHSTSLEGVIGASRSVVDYLRDMIAERRARPRDDIISYAVTNQIEGRSLTEDELVGFAFQLFIGGLDTVSGNLGLQFRHLAMRPDHQNHLRRNPEEIPTAIDELMRAFAAVTTFRTCVKETEVRGVRIMPGDKVAMATTLAARDADEYERPNEVILDRKPKHVSFGYGPHLCLGMHLARRELRIAMEEFLTTIPEFSIAPDAKIVSYLGGMIQPATLPLVWRP